MDISIVHLWISMKPLPVVHDIQIFQFATHLYSNLYTLLTNDISTERAFIWLFIDMKNITISYESSYLESIRRSMPFPTPPATLYQVALNKNPTSAVDGQMLFNSFHLCSFKHRQLRALRVCQVKPRHHRFLFLHNRNSLS